MNPLKKVQEHFNDIANGRDEEPNCCAFCGKPTRFPDDKFCSEDCEFDYNEPPKLVTRRSAAIIKIALNNDISYHD